MSRKIQRVSVVLDCQGIEHLSEPEIALILRGADELIMRGGRSLLAKVLKGSQSKQLKELNLDQSPVFGGLCSLSLHEITARIDWLIINKYLAIEYAYRLPLLVFTSRGWEIEKKSLTTEIINTLDDVIASRNPAPDLTWLNDVHPEVIQCLLERIESSGNHKYVPLLDRWSRTASRKKRGSIRQLLERLERVDYKRRLSDIGNTRNVR
ncbi:MAG: RQC-minor-1 family DNA-binding protein [Proteobacteria bacterium]|nr:RQC-minor-1 family DNA-binding protein [Pseudomonadota bacterium]